MSAREAERTLTAFYDQQDGRRLHKLIEDTFKAEREAKAPDGVTVWQLRDALASFPQDAVVKVKTWDDQGYSSLHNPDDIRRSGHTVIVDLEDA